MSGIFGVLGLSDTDNSYINTVGQAVVFEAANQYLAQVTAEINAATAVFVEETTELFKERYYLPGGGRLQRRGGQAQSGAVKASGYWDVAYPLEDFGAQVAGDDVSLAYMTLQQLQRHFDTVQAQDTNTVRFEVLRALFNNTARTFVDPLKGSLTIQPLALASDSVLYPPVLGSETEATDTHHLESGYAATAISDTNNPIVTIVDELEEHFGAMTGGENIVIFINNAQTAKIKALTDFEEVPDSRIRVGDSISVPTALPNVPGRIIGRGSGAWVVEWRWIPANYMLGMHMDAPAPLKIRVDEAASGLPRGLNLVSTDATYPFQAAHYRHRFGIGVGNRLNGVVMELGVGGTYTIPTAYA
jgi:hypothetical protein